MRHSVEEISIIPQKKKEKHRIDLGSKYDFDGY